MTVNDSYTQNELNDLAAVADKMLDDLHAIGEEMLKIQIGLDILRGLNQVDIIGEDAE